MRLSNDGSGMNEATERDANQTKKAPAFLRPVYEALLRRHPQSASARWGFALKPFLI